MAHPRASVVANLRKRMVARTVAESDDPKPVEDIPPAKPGEMRLYSFYEPSLKADTYTITVEQTLNYTAFQFNEKLQKVEEVPKTANLDAPDATTPARTQTFTVIAPQFKIEDKDIHSCYPPQGHVDQPSVLPHIVFNDPHLPWARAIKEGSGDEEDMIPWLALFPFDCNSTRQELRLTDEQLNGPTPIVPPKLDSTGAPIKTVQSSTFTLPMTVSEYLHLPDRATTAPGSTKIHIPPFSDKLKDPDYDRIKDDPTPVEVIFLSAALFGMLFPKQENSKSPDIAPFRFLSHVRNVNTAGMPSTGISTAGMDDTGVFSIIHSKRTGPTDIEQGKAPRSQAVHLISLELVDQMDASLIDPTDLVAFVSLNRWTYLCQPPQIVNFVDSMRAIGDQIWDYKTQKAIQSCLLRCPDSLTSPLRSRIEKIKSLGQNVSQVDDLPPGGVAMLQNVVDRLDNGYSIVRYRPSSGQETVAWNRGVLIPVPPAVPPASNWPFASNDGQNYQIFDKASGLMDVSYSSAWEVGKLLAGSDVGFVAALMRHRTDLHVQGVTAASIVKAKETVGIKSSSNTMSNLPNVGMALQQMTSFTDGAHASAPDLRQRWSHNDSSKDASVTPGSAVHVQMQAAFVAGVQNASQSASSTQGSNGSQPFDDLSRANSTDWEYIHKWLLDKMYLSNIPAHYLVGDPSFLPAESIRFFHLDRNWMECFMDGALSVANHMARDDDQIRQTIKDELNRYFETPFTTNDGTHYPQVPSYGFLLRSAVVTIFPDLVVQIPYPDPEESSGCGRSPILLQKHMGTDILMVLLDRSPEQIGKIILQQPPHQQRFSAGDSLEKDSIEFLFRKLYPDSVPSDFLHEFGDPHTFHSTDAKPTIYDWETQCLNMNFMDNYMFGDQGIFSALDEWKSTATRKFALSSSIAALELNDTIKYLEIKGFNSLTAASVAPQPYRIRVPEAQATVQMAKDKLIAIKSASTPATLLENRANSGQTLSQTSMPVAAARFVSKATKPANPATSTRTPPASGSTGTNTQAPPASTTSTSTSTRTLPSDKPASLIPTITQAPQSPTFFGNGEGSSCFSYTIFPSTSKFPGTDDTASFVYVDTPYVSDLMFAVNILPPAQLLPQGLHLREIEFRVPLIDESSRGTDFPEFNDFLSLCPNGAAPPSRGRMLNNQRWVVKVAFEGVPQKDPNHPDPNAPHAWLIIRVIPRSTNRSVPVELNNNISFKLDEVDLGGLTLPFNAKAQKPEVGQVKITAAESYGMITQRSPKIIWSGESSAFTEIVVERKTGWAKPI